MLSKSCHRKLSYGFPILWINYQMNWFKSRSFSVGLRRKKFKSICETFFKVEFSLRNETEGSTPFDVTPMVCSIYTYMWAYIDFRDTSNQFNEEFPIACIRSKCQNTLNSNNVSHTNEGREYQKKSIQHSAYVPLDTLNSLYKMHMHRSMRNNNNKNQYTHTIRIFQLAFSTLYKILR